MPKGPKTHHVVPNPKGGWDVKRGGAGCASSHRETKRDAIHHGRVLCRNRNTELRIHHKNGQISRGDSLGNDPFPPKGLHCLEIEVPNGGKQ